MVRIAWQAKRPAPPRLTCAFQHRDWDVVALIPQPIGIATPIGLLHQNRRALRDQIDPARQPAPFERERHLRSWTNARLRRALPPRDELMRMRAMPKQAPRDLLESCP